MTLSRKLRIAQKKIIDAKNDFHVNSNLPCKFGNFEENLIFVRPKRSFWTPVVPKRKMTWYEILRPSLFSAHWHLLCQDDILSCDRVLLVTRSKCVPEDSKLMKKSFATKNDRCVFCVTHFWVKLLTWLLSDVAYFLISGWSEPEYITASEKPFLKPLLLLLKPL